MTITQILGFFFLLYLVKVKYPRNVIKAIEDFNHFFEEILQIFGAVIEKKCLEGFGSFGDWNVFLKQEKGGYFLKMEFQEEENAKKYAKILSECRTYNEEDLKRFGIDPQNLFRLGGQINLLLKSDFLRWEKRGKTIEIKIGKNFN